MVYLDATRAIGGGLKRYIEYISSGTEIYDFVIGDRSVLEEIYAREKIIDSETFTKKTADSLTGQDIIHFPAGTMTDLKFRRLHCKIIVTIHDCTPLRVKVLSEKETKIWIKNTRNALKQADLVIAISRTTKDDIKIFFPETDQSKIHVIYNGVSPVFEKRKEYSPIDTRFRYSFFLGRSRIRHKNFWRSLLAFRLSRHFKDCLLYTTLSDTPKINFLFYILMMRKHVCLLGDLTDDEMINIFNQIDALIFMSLYEGFGLPPVEAMRCGAAVICSDIKICHEIYGDVPYYADPHKVTDIMRAITLCVEDTRLRERKRENGLSLGEKYRLEEMVSATAGLVERLKMRC